MSIENVILKKIKATNKPLLFRDFMNMALYYPELGYYSGFKEKISSNGDFITVTSQTSLFARTFARQFALVISELGRDSNLIEFGAGSGKFAVDCMHELNSLSSLPDKYIIVELSNDLKSRQQENVRKNIPELYDRFEWVTELPSYKLKAVVFANEVLDAMPVDIFRAENNQLIQQGVDWTDNEFKLVDIARNDKLFEYEANRVLLDNICFEDGYTSEINTWIRPWIKSLYDILESGMIFLCDYGYHRSLYYSKERSMGTLACYHQHKVNFDPFINIGEQDITAHVDFTTVAEAATETGFQLDGYITQANFLKKAGIANVFDDVSKNLKSKDQLRYANDIKELLLNDKLAEVFKVISFSVNFDYILDSFDNEDNIDYLL
ncbi:class I SAM-dependent methyltransferase [Francisella philomiragia]|uniref:S-adenosyl-L-methionine-dependent methyltransferase family protein n=1 Tax=Francisella philomiragia TaxID=28110 RepID=A0A0B6D8N5_9GAMM|nr:SAM-dependent methyltransferase [Francisella philomiragia]AJI53983.1 S-adenosyl-L-methionine-dependent methyltransferase family protein [Francisella philomiragia]